MKITGLGLLNDVCPQALGFTKVTLIHAENARGKSTLSALFRSVNSGEVTELQERRTIGGTDDPSATLRFDTSVDVVLDKGSWSAVRGEIAVFDADFVDKNVYSGITVTTSHRKNLLDFALGSSAVAARDKSSKADTAFDSSRRAHEVLSEKLVPAHEAQTFAQFKGLPKPKDFEGTKAQLTQRRTNAAEAGDIAATNGPELIPLVGLDLPTILDSFSTTVNDAHDRAELIVRDHVATMHRAGSDVPEPSTWLAEGGDYDDGDRCPYCAQLTTSVDLVKAYRTIFNDEFAALRSAVEIAARQIATLADLDERISTQVDLANALLETWRKRCAITTITFDKQAFASGVADLRHGLEGELDQKRADLTSYKPSPEAREALLAQWESVVAVLQPANAIQASNAASVATLKAGLASESLAALDKQLADLDRAHLRHSAGIVDQIAAIDAAKAEMNRLKQEKETARSELSTVMDATLSAYRVNTNKYLGLLGAPFSIGTMTGNHRAGGRSDFSIDLRGSEVRAEGGTPTFSTALSEGDKRTLALAFFLASTLEHGNVAGLTVVIDDPVSSFDANRTTATVSLLRELGAKADQVIVLSHDAHFLRQLKKRLGSNEVVAMLGIVAAPGQYSSIERIDIDEICENKYYRHYRIVRGMADGAYTDAPTAAQSIRPLLEGYLARRYPHLLSSGGSLSDYILKIEEADSPNPLSRLSSLVPEMREVGNYANPNHHDAGAGESDQPVSATEVSLYCTRALEIVYS
jgi:wobble nucleotide-excising tRNase